MHAKEIVAKIVVVAGLVALLWFGLSKFNNVANDNFDPALDNRSSQMNEIG